MKILRLIFALTAIHLSISAADVKISELTEIVSPSNNTWILVSDLDQVTKSRKYRLTNLVTQAQIGVSVQAFSANLADWSNLATSAKQDANAHLTDLADGSLTGSKVGTGINGDNVTSGTVVDARIDAAIARDAEVAAAYQPLDADLTSAAAGITGLVKGAGNGNGYSAAVANTDYLPVASPTFTGTLTGPTSAIATETLGSSTVTNNIASLLSAGNTNVLDLAIATQTNEITAAITFAHATNGISGAALTHVRTFYVPSGGPHTLVLPSWRTNVYSAVPPALTNGTITMMYVKGLGATASAATQTNCYVSFEYYK